MIYKVILRAAGRDERCLTYDEDGRIHAYVTAEDAEPTLAVLNAAYGDIFFLGDISSSHARLVQENPETDTKKPHPNDALDDRLRKRCPDTYTGGLIPADWGIESAAPVIEEEEEEVVSVDDIEEESTDEEIADILGDEEEEIPGDEENSDTEEEAARLARAKLFAKFRRGIPSA